MVARNRFIVQLYSTICTGTFLGYYLCLRYRLFLLKDENMYFKLPFALSSGGPMSG